MKIKTKIKTITKNIDEKPNFIYKMVAVRQWFCFFVGFCFCSLNHLALIYLTLSIPNDWVSTFVFADIEEKEKVTPFFLSYEYYEHLTYWIN